MKFFFLSLVVCFGLSKNAFAKDCTLQMTIGGDSIGVATLDYLERGHKSAARKCSSILLLLNTPGGDLHTTRLIVEKILNSRIPYLCLIYPSGGHAGSAGAIIMQACHVAGGMESTNIGAATPIAGGGADLNEDLRKKIINDTVSWVESLAEKRKRNKKFGKEIITEAKSVSSKEAVRLGGIDFEAKSKEDFLKFAEKRQVDLLNQEGVVQVGELKEFGPDFRYKVLDLFMDPQFAYMIFMGSIGLLWFEFTHPGTMVPGIVGAIGLLISLVSFHKLAVSWAGLVLMVLGLGFMIAETFVVSFGILAIGGIISFVLGGIFLFENNVFGYELPFYSTILPVAVTVGMFMLILAVVLAKSRKVKKSYGEDQLVGKIATVMKVYNKGKYRVSCEGAVWSATCDDKIFPGDEVKVVGVDGLLLKVAYNKEDD